MAGFSTTCQQKRLARPLEALQLPVSMRLSVAWLFARGKRWFGGYFCPRDAASMYFCRVASSLRTFRP
ncbi:hypothetical protein CA85_07280 [Allorhodopirellula solitaria]|uniref:Uncharacterized protein n=1 Tax=Allorhodopirellula solitaria TaxID=2527987 RepID=A0A5C5YKR3_9BACT|nr:hypothetical protein CA85_07280 [Allorhodopirellula solitaria]